MSKFIVHGGAKLEGEFLVQGSKNAAFPAMAAALLTDKTCEILNVPEVADVKNFLSILKFLGARCEFTKHRVKINTQKAKNKPLPSRLMGKLRGSLVLVGPMLVRFGQVKFAHPGGDAIGRRAIDVHLDGFRKLGARVWEGRRNTTVIARSLRGNRIVLRVTTVTGTENLLLAAVLALGTTEIRLAATEPHVQNLCRLLETMGAEITGMGTSNLKLRGVKKLGGAHHRLNSDEIETITVAVAAAATKGRVLIRNLELEYLDAPLSLLERMGVVFKVGRNSLLIKPKPGAFLATRIITGVFPQLLTDYQPLFGVLATQARGETTIHDWIYEGRQGYLRSLARMGAKVKFEDIHRARIYGPTRLHGAEIRTPDIRAGASILIAALLAKGRSVIYNAEIIDRGYEQLDEKLRALGARIERVQ